METLKIIRLWISGTLTACLTLGLAAPAFAIPEEQVFRSTQAVRFTGKCCFSFNESVQVTEPATPVPVVVTWSAELAEANDFVFAGLMVNGGECRFYGPGFILDFSTSPSRSRTFQWVVFPADGLQPGSNTLTLCGGGGSSDQAVLFLDANTLAVRLSK